MCFVYEFMLLNINLYYVQMYRLYCELLYIYLCLFKKNLKKNIKKCKYFIKSLLKRSFCKFSFQKFL